MAPPIHNRLPPHRHIRQLGHRHPRLPQVQRLVTVLFDGEGAVARVAVQGGEMVVAGGLEGASQGHRRG